jgi:hypothetical protein
MFNKRGDSGLPPEHDLPQFEADEVFDGHNGRRGPNRTMISTGIGVLLALAFLAALFLYRDTLFALWSQYMPSTTALPEVSSAPVAATPIDGMTGPPPAAQEPVVGLQTPPAMEPMPTVPQMAAVPESTPVLPPPPTMVLQAPTAAVPDAQTQGGTEGPIKCVVTSLDGANVQLYKDPRTQEKSHILLEPNGEADVVGMTSNEAPGWWRVNIVHSSVPPGTPLWIAAANCPLKDPNRQPPAEQLPPLPASTPVPVAPPAAQPPQPPGLNPQAPPVAGAPPVNGYPQDPYGAPPTGPEGAPPVESQPPILVQVPALYGTDIKSARDSLRASGIILIADPQPVGQDFQGQVCTIIDQQPAPTNPEVQPAPIPQGCFIRVKYAVPTNGDSCNIQPGVQPLPEFSPIIPLDPGFCVEYFKCLQANARPVPGAPPAPCEYNNPKGGKPGYGNPGYNQPPPPGQYVEPGAPAK